MRCTKFQCSRWLSFVCFKGWGEHGQGELVLFFFHKTFCGASCKSEGAERHQTRDKNQDTSPWHIWTLFCQSYAGRARSPVPEPPVTINYSHSGTLRRVMSPETPPSHFSPRPCCFNSSAQPRAHLPWPTPALYPPWEHLVGSAHQIW